MNYFLCLGPRPGFRKSALDVCGSPGRIRITGEVVVFECTRDGIFRHFEGKSRDAEGHVGCGRAVAVSGQRTEPLDRELRVPRRTMGKALLLLYAAFYRAPVLFLLELIAAGHLHAECLGPRKRPSGTTAQKNEREEPVSLPVFRLAIRKAWKPAQASSASTADFRATHSPTSGH
jgi:hypothetical protein